MPAGETFNIPLEALSKLRPFEFGCGAPYIRLEAHMSPVETVPLGEQLKRIESDIRKLKIQYDLYFIGSSLRPPNDQRDMVKKAIRQFEGVPMRNSADRFFYNALVNKFRAFSELWNKGVRKREEGARIHPLAVRAAHKAARAETGGTFRPPVGAGAVFAVYPAGWGSGSCSRESSFLCRASSP